MPAVFTRPPRKGFRAIKTHMRRVARIMPATEIDLVSQPGGHDAEPATAVQQTVEAQELLARSMKVLYHFGAGDEVAGFSQHAVLLELDRVVNGQHEPTLAEHGRQHRA